MERKIGLFSRRAFANASSPHGNQSTGLSACWRRYGDFSRARRLAGLDSVEPLLIAHPIALLRKAKEGRFPNRPPIRRRSGDRRSLKRRSRSDMRVSMELDPTHLILLL